MFDIPDQIIGWVSSVFSDCNERLSEKLSNNPNTPETSLDVTFIEHLSRYSSPITFGTSWTVKIETHFIGGRRHFHGWEIADIGVLVFFKRQGRVIRKKVALLQAKRLYPLSGAVEEEVPEDILIGISYLVREEPGGIPLSRIINYEFGINSRYKALKYLDKQHSAIEGWNNETEISVHYMFYNPWTLPFRQQVPLKEYVKPPGYCKLGTRIVPSEKLFQHLQNNKANYSPKIGDLKELMPSPHTWVANAYGWRLESFFIDLLKCKEGYIFETQQDESINRLFYRKDAMLSAAISITVELND